MARWTENLGFGGIYLKPDSTFSPSANEKCVQYYPSHPCNKISRATVISQLFVDKTEATYVR